MGWTSAPGRTSFCSEERGQSSVEAGILLPVLLGLLALLLQPGCLLYTKAVMSGAAAEVVRAAATTTDVDALRGYALRRLSAVPEVSVFHVGGEGDWQVEVTGAGGSRVEVGITGHARPFPLLGVMAGLLGETDGEGVVLRVDASARVRPDWVGGDYGGWIGIWG